MTGYDFDTAPVGPPDGKRRATLKAALIIIALVFAVVAWILIAGGRKTTVIITAPPGAEFSVDGDDARPRMRPGSDSTTNQVHYLRLSQGTHEIVVREPNGEEHAHMLQIEKRDRPLMLQVRNRELQEIATPPGRTQP